LHVDGGVGVDLFDTGDEAGLELLDQLGLDAADEADVAGAAGLGGDAAPTRYEPCSSAKVMRGDVVCLERGESTMAKFTSG
jgi:hypothetical protein